MRWCEIVKAARDPRPGKRHSILIACYNTKISIEYLSTIVSIYAYSLSFVAVNHIIHLGSSIVIHALALYSIFCYRIGFADQTIQVLPLQSKNDTIYRKWTTCASILPSIVYYIPENASRDSLHLASIRSSTDNRRSPLSRETRILTRGASVAPQDEIHDEGNQDNEENTAIIEVDLSKPQGDNLSDVLGCHLR